MERPNTPACSKAEQFCSASEHCIAEVQAKLATWGADEHEAAAILAHLLHDGYINETRYAVAFTRDKYRFNQWGRVKIQQALRLKHLSNADIQEGLEAIDEDEYLDTLRQLVAQKRRSVKAATEYERNAKLLRFVIGKGYEMSEALKCIKAPEYED
jgi:regulatory protein